ncbi:hypothetical protein HMF8227_01903 [Saliniradius amylolyticus]|uniref:Uncharacterized protein n=1 Tax=Saliniradius amylolyticus TaxID=2183582 RepID=A0A2S2E412_9ALTE|nr:hypothetical protein [Saliniradius amylolyticus]AWL12373.1 hypothetical protein HMF8227_01903 [Saliniradius amylolyticus]
MSNTQFQQLRGLAKGILASGEPTAAEFNYLKRYFGARPELAGVDELAALAALLERTSEPDSEALGELMGLLIPLQTLETDNRQIQGESPVLYFPFSRFAVIGTLTKTSRDALEEHLDDQAAQLTDTVTPYTDYVILADKPRTAEKDKVKQLREQGYPLAIVEETELCQALSVFEGEFDDSAEAIVQWIVSLAEDMTARLPEDWALAQQDDRLSFGVYARQGNGELKQPASIALTYGPEGKAGDFTVSSPFVPEPLRYQQYPFAMARFYKEAFRLIEG